MATKAKPSDSADSMVARSVIPPRRTRGVESAAQELPGVGEEEGLLVGIAAQKALPDDPEAETDRRGQGGGELLQGRFAAEEVHGIGQRAAPGELERIERAVLLEERGHLQAVLEPQATVDAVGHVELGRDRGARTDLVAHGAQDGTGEAGPVLHRAAELVVALVELGAEERAQQIVVPDVHLDAVEAGLDRDPGAAAGSPR